MRIRASFYVVAASYLCVTLVHLSNAKGAIIEQSHHRRTLIFEGWRGSSLRSSYSQDKDLVHFEVCNVETRGQCESLTDPMTIEQLGLHQNRMLQEMREFREDVAAQVNGNPLSFLTGGADRNLDVQTLDQLAEEIEILGLRDWIKISDENLRSLPPALENPEVMDALLEKVKRTLEEPIRPAILPNFKTELPTRDLTN